MIRPMRREDVPAAERLSATSFHDLDLRTARASDPEPELRPAVRADAWVTRTDHLLVTDPGGCWVAEDATGMVGMVTSLVRETTWILATYAVRPGLQGQGIGRQVLAPALHHGRAALHGMLSASSDPRALRHYRSIGFDLHPQMHLSGTVDRSVLPVVEKVREGAAADTELMDSIDRRTRGAGHGPDHALMQRLWRPLVSDTTTGSGYAYVSADGRLELLAATNRRTASRLLWAVLADGGAQQRIGHVTGANAWAVEVGMAAGLDLHTEGYLGVRGLKPPTPYLHHGALL